MFLAIIILLLILIFLWIICQTTMLDWVCSIIVKRSKRYHYKKRAKRIILIRHGESQGNQDSSIYCTVPDHAIGLTEKGQEQARACGAELKDIIGKNETILFFVSPFRRSKETCDLICQSFLDEKIIKIREDPRIREQEWGNFQDLATREITVRERKKIGRFFYRFKDGESGADVYDRVSSFMESLYREMDNCSMPNNNILIVSHGLFIRLFLMRFYRWSVEKFHTLENFNNCDYCILERDDHDASFILKTELKTYPDRNSISIEKTNFKTFDQHSFNEEIHPSIHIEHIGQNGKKDN